MYERVTWRDVMASTLDAGRALSGVEMPDPHKVTRSQIIDAIFQYVCEKHNLTKEEIVGKCRRKPFTTARFEAMALIREQTNLSLPAIGRLFGGRDHTTVINALWRHSNKKKKIPQHIADSIRSIIGHVCEKYGVSWQAVLVSQVMPYTMARFEAMALMYEEIGMTYKEIGWVFDKDGSTVMTSIRRYNQAKGQ